MCWAVFTTLCRALQLRAVQLPYQVVIQDPLYGAPVEVAKYPGVHVEPPQPAEEEEPLSGWFCDGVCVVSSGQILADVNPEEPQAADSLNCSSIDGEDVSFSLC